MSANVLPFRRPACHDPEEIYSAHVIGVIHGDTEGEGDRPLEIYVADGYTTDQVHIIVGDPSTVEQVVACISLTGEQARQFARSILGKVT